MFSSSRAVSNLFITARPRCGHNKHVSDPFSSLSDQFKEGVRPGESNDTKFGGGINSVPDQMTTDVRNKGTRNDNEMTTAARDTAADMAKAAVVGALETGLKLGEMAKQTMDGMWDATKRTTETVRDSMADDDNNNNNDDIRGRQRLSDDKHVEDLRRKARGYDLKG